MHKSVQITRQVCREVYCSSNFDLVDFECIGDTDFGGNGTTGNPPIMLPSSDVAVNLTALAWFPLSLDGNASWSLNGSTFDNETMNAAVAQAIIEELFVERFADFLFISYDRISNLSVRYETNQSLSSTENIVNQLAEATAAWFESGNYDADNMLSFDDIAHVVRRLDHEKEAFEFKVVQSVLTGIRFGRRN